MPKILTKGISRLHDQTKEYKINSIVVHNNSIYVSNNDIPADTAFEIGTTGATWRVFNGSTVSGGYRSLNVDDGLFYLGTGTKENLKTLLTNFHARIAAGGDPTDEGSTQLLDTIKNYDTSSVTSFDFLFAGMNASSLQHIDFSLWDTSNVVSMRGMANGQTITAKQFGYLQNWNVSKCKDFTGAFLSSFITVDADSNGYELGWDMSSAITIENMFSRALVSITVVDANTPTDLGISKFVTPRLQNMKAFMKLTTGIGLNDDLDFKDWDVSKVTNFDEVFGEINTKSRVVDTFKDLSFDSLELVPVTWTDLTITEPNWGQVQRPITHKELLKFVADYRDALANDPTKTTVLGNRVAYANTSELERIEDLQVGPDFNLDLSFWDVSKVKSFKNAFANANIFNQDLSMWNTESVVSFEKMFYNAFVFDGNVTTWDLTSCKSIAFMFENAGSFNQPIGPWDTTTVETMEGTFKGASTFNRDLSNWNTENVENMDNMFDGAVAFNGGNA